MIREDRGNGGVSLPRPGANSGVSERGHSAGRLSVTLAMMALSSVPSFAETPRERGRYLVAGIAACGSCHAADNGGGNIEDRPLSGGAMFSGPGFVGYAANITPDPATGIGNWSEADIVRALREGKRPDGRTLGLMPFDLYRRISDRDAFAIAAYLRSLKPVRKRVPRSSYTPPLPARYGPPVASVSDPPKGDPIARGEYLAGPLGRCVECHTPSTNGRPDYENMLGAGGAVFTGPWGMTVSGNLTPDRDTGLGAFSDSQIKKMIAAGARPNDTWVGPPMAHAFYARLTVADLDAVVAYLRSLKPIKNFVDK